MNKKRENIFDIMKGVGIILMIIGHGPIPLLLRNFIFSFHMPLFFIISGFFFKPRLYYTFFNDFKRLILPYLFVCSLLILHGIVKDGYKNSYFEFTQYWVIASLWGGGIFKSTVGFFTTHWGSLVFANAFLV
ncbi:MAG: acyltransferase family protein [Prevotellaceae bacterium]|jgi:fucose 4-O-acetylase-like acetyltransferase|nr:acyltransferase family protein [Prevotellaceae bacterium]